MRTIPLAAVADAGLVRLGAGVRQPGRAAPSPSPRPLPQVAGPILVTAPPAVADSGRVRLGAGVRRG